jgi:hypothetical protein
MVHRTRFKCFPSVSGLLPAPGEAARMNHESGTAEKIAKTANPG